MRGDNLYIWQYECSVLRPADSLQCCILLPTDSLPAADSLQLTDSLLPTDSVSLAVPPRRIEPGDIFGETSILIPAYSPPAPAPERFNLCDTLTFRFTAFALLLCYCGTLIFYRFAATSLCKIVGNRLHTEKLIAERSFVFKHFLTGFSFIGALAWPLVFMRVVNLSEISASAAQFPEWAAAITLFVLVVAMLLFYLYRHIVLKLAGWLTLSDDFTDNLSFLTRMVFALMTMLLTPALLLFAINRDPLPAKVLAIFIVSGMISGMAIFLLKTLHLFRSQKFSILHWFLYLCAVEFFPVSFVALAALRN